MADISTFYPSVVGGGIPKYAEFTSNGTWTPPQALIDAGGRVSYLVVGGGGSGCALTNSSNYMGGSGGTVKTGYETLTNTNSIAITIGAGGAASAQQDGNDGADSVIAFTSAGGTSVTATGGKGAQGISQLNATENGNGWGAISVSNTQSYSNAHPGYMGIYGRGGGASVFSGDKIPAANTGSGSAASQTAADGFVRITWYE